MNYKIFLLIFFLFSCTSSNVNKSKDVIFKDSFSNKYNVIDPKDIFRVLKEYKVKKIDNKIIQYANDYFTKIDINQIKSLL